MLKQGSSGIALLLWAGLALAYGNHANGANPAFELEPNNTTATANAIALGDGEFRGNSSFSGDNDYYVFQSPGGVVTFEIRSAVQEFNGPAWLFEIRNQNGDILNTAVVNDTVAPTTVSANTLPGIHYLVMVNSSVGGKQYIVNPLGPAPPQSGCTLDLDGNGSVDALTDGLMLLRAMFGLSGAAITTGAVGTNATRTDWTTIRTWLNANCGTSFPG